MHNFYGLDCFLVVWVLFEIFVFLDIVAIGRSWWFSEKLEWALSIMDDCDLLVGDARILAIKSKFGLVNEGDYLSIKKWLNVLFLGVIILSPKCYLMQVIDKYLLHWQVHIWMSSYTFQVCIGRLLINNFQFQNAIKLQIIKSLVLFRRSNSQCKILLNLLWILDE